jgi:hypothetical protein
VARGYGATEKACELGAVEAMALRAKVLEAKLEGQERFVGQTGPGEFFGEHEQGIEQAIEELLVRRSHDYEGDVSFGPKRRCTGRDPQSGFSTGTFTKEAVLPAQGSHDVNADRLQQEVEVTSLTIRRAWERACLSDHETFKKLQRNRIALEKHQN